MKIVKCKFESRTRRPLQCNCESRARDSEQLWLSTQGASVGPAMISMLVSGCVYLLIVIIVIIVILMTLMMIIITIVVLTMIHLMILKTKLKQIILAKLQT